ncbi:MAG: hypothetical protein HQL76_08855 [Magnetococcales bacterium]|nr:hypothetical protein [Magnetococcales bacterium]
MIDDSHAWPGEDLPAATGLERQEPLDLDSGDEAPGGRPLGIGPRTIRSRDGTKELTIR